MNNSYFFRANVYQLQQFHKKRSQAPSNLSYSSKQEKVKNFLKKLHCEFCHICGTYVRLNAWKAHNLKYWSICCRFKLMEFSGYTHLRTYSNHEYNSPTLRVPATWSSVVDKLFEWLKKITGRNARAKFTCKCWCAYP